MHELSYTHRRRAGSCDDRVWSPPSRQHPPPTFKTGTQVVSLFATVSRRAEASRAGPVQEEFEVFDNEKPQPIVFFDNEVQPITVVVMLDTSGSMTLTIDLLKQAAEQFVIRLLPDDKATRRRVQRQDPGSARISRTTATSWSAT